MATRLEDGRIQVADGRALDQGQVQALLMSYFMGDDSALDVCAEILRDCPGPKGVAGLGGISGPVGSCGPVAGPDRGEK